MSSILKNQAIQRDNVIPNPPFWGSRCIEHIPLRAVIPYINKTTLYKFQWGFKSQGKSPEAYQAWAKQEVDPILNRLMMDNEDREMIQPQAVYGYFPCLSDGNDLIIFQDEKKRIERCRFTFPRQKKGRGLCIADYFRSVESDETDVVAFQLVTVGQKTSDYARELFEGDKYQEYLYWHGLNVESTEAMAEYIHKRIRTELGFCREDARNIADMIKQGYRGSRYSFGYPACPNLHDQDQILELLGAERINVSLGDEDQLWPEESTSAIVLHHPEAKYFSV
ncbi:MAG: vitamin B12 dependent-methionine synthase activation domain-containing protein [Gammaproteobacteria bacterium]